MTEQKVSFSWRLADGSDDGRELVPTGQLAEVLADVPWNSWELAHFGEEPPCRVCGAADAVLVHGQRGRDDVWLPLCEGCIAELLG